MAAVVGQLAQYLQVHPAQRAWPGPVAGYDGVERQVGNRRPGGRAGLSVGCRDGGDGVIIGEQEGLVRALYQTKLATGRAADAL